MEGGDTDFLCTVLADQQGDNNTAYSVSVQLYADTEGSSRKPLLGIAFNVQDIKNYDFALYRYEGVRGRRSERMRERE
jgi:hypothetical protein